MRSSHSQWLAAILACAGAWGLASPAHAQTYTENLASSTVIGDVEFDWGREGVQCPTCNFGIGNAQFNWTDRLNNLWVGTVNLSNGTFNSQMTQVDTGAFFWMAWGNGPEWAFSTQNGQVVSQLVYTRFPPGDPATAPYAGAGFATQTAPGVWQAQFLPGAVGPYNGNGSQNMVLPEASQCLTDPVATVLFANLATPQQMFTMPVSGAAGTQMTQTPFGPYANGIGERFVPCTQWLTFQGNAPPGPQGNIIQQVFWYNWATGAVQQLTTDATAKQRALMFKAPEFNDGYVLMTLAAGNQIRFYQVTGFNANGSPILSLYSTLNSPEAAEPYIFDPKVFIHCNPTCQTYVVYGITSVSGSQTGLTTPNGLALGKMSLTSPMNTLIASGATGYPYQRLDPKYFILPSGPVVYYDRIVPLTSKTIYNNQGVYFISLGLGPPSGPCVGSSAEGGTAPGC